VRESVFRGKKCQKKIKWGLGYLKKRKTATNPKNFFPHPGITGGGGPPEERGGKKKRRLREELYTITLKKNNIISKESDKVENLGITLGSEHLSSRWGIKRGPRTEILGILEFSKSEKISK